MSLSRGQLVTEALVGDHVRDVTVYVPPGDVDAVVYAADGGWHTVRLGGALEAAGISSTMIVGVHGCDDDDERLRDYVLGFDAERFVTHERFFVNDVSEWVGSRFGVTVPVNRTGVWGASLGGELALALGVRHPDVYGAVFATSPGAGYKPPADLTGPLPHFYLVAGTEEQFFLDNATRWANTLREIDAEVVMTERAGGHGDAFWVEELPLMVAWAFDH